MSCCEDPSVADNASSAVTVSVVWEVHLYITLPRPGVRSGLNPTDDARHGRLESRTAAGLAAWWSRRSRCIIWINWWNRWSSWLWLIWINSYTDTSTEKYTGVGIHTLSPSTSRLQVPVLGSGHASTGKSTSTRKLYLSKHQVTVPVPVQ